MKQFVNFVLVTFLVFASGVMWAEEANPASDFVYDLNEEGTGVVIKKYKGKAVDVVIPSVIEDFPVVNCNLSENETIVSVVLPDTCTQFKFYGCKSLEKVTFPKYLKYLPGEIGGDYYYGEYSYYNNQ